MTENNRRLTFSQRNGLAPIPRPLNLWEISDDFRKDCWNKFYFILSTSGLITNQNNLSGTYEESSRMLLREIEVDFFRKTEDEANSFLFHVNDHLVKRERKEKYKSFFLGEEYNKIFDLIEFILRNGYYGRAFFADFSDIFRKNLLAYTIVDEECPTIVPAATPEEGETIRQAFEDAKGDKYAAVRKHLRKSAEQINANQPADAIRESIHAVESVLRIVTGEKDFRQALQALEKSRKMHPALKDAFTRLYGYTSDEQGIRHALVDQPQSPSGMEEAVFMLGACAAFVSYVIRKSSAPGAAAAPSAG